MTVAKLRAALVVFLLGFALGVAVFATSRMVVRSILSSDAVSTAEALATELAQGKPVEPNAAVASIVRYTYFDAAGKVITNAEPGDQPADAPSIADIRGFAALAGGGSPVVQADPLVASLLGLSEPNIRRVAVPVMRDGAAVGTVFVEVDQTRALESLTHAFAVIGIVSIGLAVLTVIGVALAVTRGRGFAREHKVFDPASLPRDALTGVPTRQGLMQALEDVVERTKASDGQFHLLIVDLEGFRAVNDIWGLGVGDEVLTIAAERLSTFATGPAGIARISGDEFALIVEGEATESTRRLTERIREAMSAPFEVGGSSIMLGARIGAALYPVNADTPEVLFRAASTALSAATGKGRNAVAVFDTEMKEQMMRAEALECDLRQALDREEFVVFYQPQLELASGRLRGYEALVRWERPGQGIMAPRDFLSVAEDTGLIRPLGDWVLRKACEDAATWLDSGTVAVNFSAAQFRAQELDKTIARVLAEVGLPAERLEIEVPESLFLDGAPEILETLGRIKALGVRVAMDDFGAGYSGLSSLARFPFDKIKIDRSFVAQLTDDADVAAIISSIVSLGRTLSLDVTAEGVETSEQVTMLKAAGCSIVQGFLFGFPKRGGPRAAEDAAPVVANAASGGR